MVKRDESGVPRQQDTRATVFAPAEGERIGSARPETDVFAPGLAEAKRRLSLGGMHDGKCPEPDAPCTCGLDAAIDNPNPEPWYKPAIEDGDD